MNKSKSKLLKYAYYVLCRICKVLIDFGINVLSVGLGYKLLLAKVFKIPELSWLQIVVLTGAIELIECPIVMEIKRVIKEEE